MRILKRSVLCALLIIILFGCLSDKTPPISVEYAVLKWHKSYTYDSFEKGVTGLNWALSHIGTNQLIPSSRIFESENIVHIYPSELGLKESSQAALLRLHTKINASEAYQKRGFMDMGHYVALLLGSSAHYYALVDLPSKLIDLEADYSFSAVEGYINSSAISVKHRVLKFTDQNGLNQLFVSQEIDSVTGVVIEFETLDLLPNGQPRFGIFNTNGDRISGANPTNSLAGKPAKCMWCHESSIQPLFSLQTTRPSYLSPNELRDTLITFRDLHRKTQAGLNSGVDFENLTDHVLMELLYISYMEPSLSRLAMEWEMKENKVEELLKDIPTHEQEEFTFLGPLYFRKDIVQFAPYQSLSVSDNVRELEGAEVNHLE